MKTNEQKSYPKVLDPSCGKGEFLLESANRMSQRGCRDVLDRLYAADFKQLNLLVTKKRLENWAKNNNQDQLEFRNRIQYNRVEDLVEKIGTMKFDIVVGNPPYLKGMWVKFLKESVKMSTGHVALVSPDGTKNFSKKSEKLNEFLKENGVQHIIDCTEHFPNVKSGAISVYHLDVKNHYDPTCFAAMSVEQKILEKVVGYKSTKLDSIMTSKKTKEAHQSARYTESGEKRIQQVESIKNSGAEYTWIDTKHTKIINGDDWWMTNRYFGKNTDAVMIEHSGKIGISGNILAIKRIPDWTIDEFKIIYLSKLMKYVLNVMRNGIFDTKPQHIRQLPLIDKTVKDLYQYFGLTPKEIEHVENFTK